MTNANVKVNEVKKSSKDELLANASMYAGRFDAIVKTIERGMNKIERERRTYNWRHAQMLDSCPEKALRAYFASGEFREMVKNHLPHISVSYHKGDNLQTYDILCHYVLVEEGKKAPVAIDADVVKKFAPALAKAKNVKLLGYRYATEDTFVSCDTFEPLSAIEHSYTRVVTQTAKAADGTEYQVPVFEIDENGNRKAVREDVMGKFAVVLDESCTLKAFQKAFVQAFNDAWLQIFGATAPKEEPKSVEEHKAETSKKSSKKSTRKGSKKSAK